MKIPCHFVHRGIILNIKTTPALTSTLYHLHVVPTYMSCYELQLLLVVSELKMVTSRQPSRNIHIRSDQGFVSIQLYIAYVNILKLF